MSKKLTTEAFIRRAREVHGDLYDYSKVEYVNAKTKIIIIDPEYGEFEQSPDGHLRGQGCPARKGLKKLTTEEFIKRAQKVHNNFYDYSKTKYISAHKPVIIIDPEYGEFKQTPANHLAGHKSSYHAKNIKKTTEQFIKEAQKVNGTLYDYSKVEYVNAKTKIIIIDPEYGEFEQSPSKHLQGQGHPLRGQEKKAKSRRSNKKEFIKKAREVHGDLYDYSKVEYINSSTKVIIIDPDYGQFLQEPASHLSGRNHPLRGLKNLSDGSKLSQDEFIKRARELHGNLYDYSKVNYVDGRTKIIIIDPEYGEFWQEPRAHLYEGQGHPSRAVYGFDPEQPAYLYYLRIMGGLAYKIGITNRSVQERFLARDLEHIEIVKIWSYPLGSDAQKEERRILNEFKDVLYDGDYLLESGNTELFKYDILELDNDGI